MWQALVKARQWALNHCTEVLEGTLNKFVQSPSGDQDDGDTIADSLPLPGDSPGENRRAA
jgi:hypothetical protein